MESLPVPHRRPSAYEREAFGEIQRWKNPESDWLGRTVDTLQDAWTDVTDLVRKIPGVDWTIENVVKGLLQVANEITQDSVWTDAIFAEFADAGHPVKSHRDIQSLDLRQVDGCVDGLNKKYVALAAAEGAATGFAGASGIVPDLIALVALNLRAAGEYATYCGIDMRLPEERYFAMEILDYVSRSRNKARDLALSPVSAAAGKVARRQGAQAIQQIGLSGAMERLAKSLGIRLTETKLAQAVPVTGAVIGGGFNAYYTDRVCKAAFHLYRERFLFAKYGAALWESE